MRFMMIIKSDDRSERGVLPDEKILTAMGNYNGELIKSGALIAGEGLQASSKGKRVRMSKKNVAAPAIVDGPFTETKELVAGFWLINAKSKAEAIEWARRVPGPDGEIEIRQLFELSDFPVDAGEKEGGWRDHEQQMREAPPAPERKPGHRRFMLLLKGNAVTESEALPSPEVLTEMGGFMESLAASGDLLGGEGLRSSRHGAKVRRAGTDRTVIDGPFTETKELIAGYLMLQSASLDDAVAHARRWLQIHLEGTPSTEGEIEVRQVFELEDFPVSPEEKPDGWRDKEQQFRDKTGQ